MPIANAAKITALERRLAKCECALRDFSAIQAELRSMGRSERVDSMLKLNGETIVAVGRSLSLIRKDLERELSR